MIQRSNLNFFDMRCILMDSLVSHDYIYFSILFNFLRIRFVSIYVFTYLFCMSIRFSLISIWVFLTETHLHLYSYRWLIRIYIYDKESYPIRIRFIYTIIIFYFWQHGKLGYVTPTFKGEPEFELSHHHDNLTLSRKPPKLRSTSYPSQFKARRVFCIRIWDPFGQLLVSVITIEVTMTNKTKLYPVIKQD